MPAILRVVQQRALSQRHWLADAQFIALLPSPRNYQRQKGNAPSSLAAVSRTLHQWSSQTGRATKGRLDQSAATKPTRQNRSPTSELPGGSQRYVFDAPSIWLSLGWLRPRRANFCFTRPTEHTIQNSFEHPSHASKNPRGSGGLVPQ